MKLTHIITLLAAALFLGGCASKEAAPTSTEVSSPAAPATGDSVQSKTAYEGSTGSGLLMERYKSGSIEGYRN